MIIWVAQFFLLSSVLAFNVNIANFVYLQNISNRFSIPESVGIEMHNVEFYLPRVFHDGLELGTSRQVWFVATLTATIRHQHLDAPSDVR